MPSTRVKDLSVVVGTYVKDGQQKNRYKTIGSLMETEAGAQYILLDPFVNIGALPRKEGADRLMVSLYAPQSENGTAQQAGKSSTAASYAAASRGGHAPQSRMPDDDIPF